VLDPVLDPLVVTPAVSQLPPLVVVADTVKFTEFGVAVTLIACVGGADPFCACWNVSDVGDAAMVPPLTVKVTVIAGLLLAFGEVTVTVPT
jgi:hypothetical protein